MNAPHCPVPNCQNYVILLDSIEKALHERKMQLSSRTDVLKNDLDKLRLTYWKNSAKLNYAQDENVRVELDAEKMKLKKDYEEKMKLRKAIIEEIFLIQNLEHQLVEFRERITRLHILIQNMENCRSDTLNFYDADENFQIEVGVEGEISAVDSDLELITDIEEMTISYSH